MQRYTWIIPALLLSHLAQSAEIPYDKHLKVDQFGYLPSAPKFAILSNPKKGYDASESYTPGDLLLVRRVADDAKVFTATAIAWKSGKTDTWSGDQVWWFDFSAVTEPGEYYIYDQDHKVRSAKFRIGNDVYKEVLRQATRTFFYQRANFAKKIPYAEANWADEASHGHAEQDTDCRAIVPNTPGTSDPATAKDLSGGWYDAGDFNKYINNADGTVHDLLLAYEENPGAWGDDFGIPESGNGIPDLLDEVKWELDWMHKMQLADGSVLHKVSSINWDATTPPSTDIIPRRYAPATASATISLAGTFAHAALVYGKMPQPELQAYAQQLRQSAEKAWNWLEANPSKIPSKYDNKGFMNVSAEDSATSQRNNQSAAALYLYVLTRQKRFETFISQAIDKGQIFLLKEKYISFDGQAQELQDALLYFSKAVPESPLSEIVKKTYEEAVYTPWVDFAPVRQYNEQGDAYRAYMNYYAWGSNQAKAAAGTTLTNLVVYGISAISDSVAQTYLNAAAGYLHYIHGTNPFSLVYLSNMGRFGAERSVDEIYHLWFRDQSKWDNIKNTIGPAPGFLVGGAQEDYDKNGVYVNGVKKTANLVKSQPILKRFSFDNGVDSAYELLEGSITYQAAYLRLLSKYVPDGANPPSAPSIITTLTGNHIRLQWYSVGADRYVLYYAPYPQATPISSLDLGNTAGAEFDLPAGANFFYAIQAGNAAGLGPFSSISQLMVR